VKLSSHRGEIIGVSRKKAEAGGGGMDVVTTGTFGPMCSSGAYFNIGHSSSASNSARRSYLNDVPAYTGLQPWICSRRDRDAG